MKIVFKTDAYATEQALRSRRAPATSQVARTAAKAVMSAPDFSDLSPLAR